MATRERPASTERPNPRTAQLDRLASRDVLELILTEDARVAEAVRAALPALADAAELLHATLRDGGRWLNVGAGTSGRLGILDAIEIPPTFGLEPDRVQALLAGGTDAMERAVEGAEDDPEAAARAVREREIGAGDAVVGISASGQTPFVLGAIEAARAAGARTLAITCDESSPLAAAVDLPICIDVGPEVVAGSTRMKGGLAQKMVLHSLSTTVMVRLGRVRGNLMAELRVVNSKLRERAVGIVAQLANVTPERARAVLDGASGSIPTALERLGTQRDGREG